jgi:hypothetical protein
MRITTRLWAPPVVAALLLGLAAPGALADTPAASLPQFQILSEDDSGITLEFRIEDLQWESVEVEGRTFDLLTIPGGSLLGEDGAPAVPTFARFVAIPPQAGVQVSWSRGEEEVVSGVTLLPMQPDEGQGFVMDLDAYARDAYGPEEAVATQDPAIARDLRLLPLSFRPVQYNPAERTLRIAHRIVVEIRYTDDGAVNVKTLPRRPIPPSFHQIYQHLVVNYHGPEASQGMQHGTYLIICPNDQDVVTRLQPLVEWRQRKGLPVVLATTAETGTSNSAIKNYIQNAYNNWELPPEYVVLVGDANGSYAIPTWFESYSGYGGEGDHPYVQLEGNDVLADAHVGRLSFNDLSELEIIVSKIVNYESSPYLDEPDWFTRACLVGDPSSSGYSVVQVQQWIKQRLLEIGYTEVDTVFTEPFVSQMLNNLNKGDTFFSYRGYWHMSGWTNSYTYALQNGWKLPYVVTITCDTGSFADGTSRTEGFLRAGDDPDHPKGGLGAVGTATIGTHTRYNNCVHYGIFQGLLYEDIFEMGPSLTRGKYELYLNYNDRQPTQVAIFSHWNNLMGDPAGEVWTAYPQAAQVAHDADIPLGANSFVVTVTTLGMPVSGAQVCLWKEDDGVQIVGVTDEQGRVELSLPDLTLGDALLTVTKHNMQPYLATVPVTSYSVYVAYDDSHIDDDTNGTSSGNGDGVLNPGETVELPVLLKNTGFAPAPGVTATLTCDDPYVTLIDASEDFGDIPGNGSAWSQDDFDFSVDPGCPDGHTIRFGLDIASGSNNWHSLIDLTVVSADFSVENIGLSNVGGNGILDPGETGNMTLTIRNNGGMDATGTTATLVSLSSYVNVTDGFASFGDIPSGATGSNTGDAFVVEANPSTYEGYLAGFYLITQFNGDVTDTTYFALTIGQRSTDDPVGPDGYGYYAFDNTDTSYPEAPTYDWVELDPNYGGDGTEIVLGDYGDYQDKSVTVDLPFTFKYYGQEFDRVTVCSNGWLAMGSTYLTNYRNWTIPGAGGPEGMLAVFWDDLYQTSSSKVFQKYDQANHRWILEWSRFRNDVGGVTETFEVILLDPAYHETETGDGEIIFQYYEVSNVDNVDGYATVGIENFDHTDGLLYTYFNLYPDGAAPLQAGRAIRFVPKAEGPLGTLRGTVTNASYGNAPIQGATVTLLENGRTLSTGPDGHYEGLVPAGTFTVVASHPSFEPDTVAGVVIPEGGETVVDFALVDIMGPIITTTPHPSTSDTLGPYPIPVTIEEYSGLEEASLYYRVNGGPFTQVALQPQGGNDYLGEIPGQPWTTLVQYYVYARDGLGYESTDPDAAPDSLYSFIVAPTVPLFSDDFESDKGWTVGAPGDNATTGIWERVDPNGTWYNDEPVQPEDDHTPDPGVMCYVTGNAPPGASQGDNDVDGGTTTLLSPVLDLSAVGSVTLRYYRWYTNDTGNAPGEDYWQVYISDDGGNTWVTLENTNQSAREWRLMEFNLNDYISLTDQVVLKFVASDLGSGSVVEAAVDDVEIMLTGASDIPEGIVRGPAVLALYPNRPNPFSARTVLRFQLDRERPVRLGIYDVTGRLVRLLVDAPRLDQGTHTVVWDGRDDAGQRVASGVYLYRLDAGGKERTRKLILLQ